MKKIALVLILIFPGIFSQAQKVEKFFDYQWRECQPSEARFYSVSERTDSGWVRKDFYLSQKRLQMVGLSRESDGKYKTGSFYYFYPNGQLEIRGRFEENKRTGPWISYYRNGLMRDSAVYDYGEIVGTAMKWHNTGFPSDSTVYNPDGTATVYQWFDDGSPSAAGRLNITNQANGKWQYFHHNGKLSSSEIYENGKLVSKTYYSENGDVLADQKDNSRGAEFPGGVQKWLTYLERNLRFPSGYQIANGDKAPMIVEFTVDEKGKVVDVNIQAPFHEAIDEAIRETLTSSPAWNPAIYHNRKVRYTHRQSITFRDR